LSDKSPCNSKGILIAYTHSIQNEEPTDTNAILGFQMLRKLYHLLIYRLT